MLRDHAMLEKLHRLIREKKAIFLLMIILFCLMALSSCQQRSLILRMDNPLSKLDQDNADLSQDQTPSQAQETKITPEPTSQPATQEIYQDDDENEMITIKILFDNYPYQEGLETAWGFSAFITYKDHNVLFDTGAVGQMLLDNMAKMEIKPP